MRRFAFSLFASVYFLSFLQRVAISVVAGALELEFGLDSVALGMMSSGFFIAYALAQPVIGLLADRAGPERVAAGALAVGAVGSFMFAAARSFGVAFSGRVLMGLGLAAGFIPGMKAIAELFPPEMFSTFNALFVTIGHAGSLVGAAPLAWMTTAAGWRAVFTGLAFVAVALAVLCAWYAVRKGREMAAGGAARQGAGDGARQGSGQGPGQGLEQGLGQALEQVRGTNREVVASVRMWLVAFFLFAKYGSQVAFQGLWGAPYIVSVYGVSPTQAAGAVTMVAVGYVVAAPFMGRLADRLATAGMDLFAAQRLLLVGSTALCVAVWIPMALAPGLVPWGALHVVIFLLGVSYSTASLAFGITKDLFPANVSGIATGLVNITSILGGAAMPPLVGWIVERRLDAGVSAHAVHAGALWPCLVAAAVSLALVAMVTRPPRARAVGGAGRG